MAEGKLAKFRDTYEFKSADHIEATSSMQGEDGKWVQFMTGQIKRKKVMPAAGATFTAAHGDTPGTP